MLYKQIDIYVDGGSRNNGSPTAKAAWANIVYIEGIDVFEIGDFCIGKTNSAMEVYALFAGIKLAYEAKDLAEKIVIYQDSDYCVKTFNQWLDGWIKSGNISQKSYSDEWKRIYEYKSKLSNVEVVKVKGHSNNIHNNAVDDAVNDLMNEGLEYNLDLFTTSFGFKEILSGIKVDVVTSPVNGTLRLNQAKQSSLAEPTESSLAIAVPQSANDTTIISIEVTDMYTENDNLIAVIPTEPIKTEIKLSLPNLANLLKPYL